MEKIKPISGFPEWLPAEKMIEQEMIQTIKEKFELFGFSPIETRAVEPLNVLLNKGDDKELYVLSRLHAEEDSLKKIGLHFDLTVPLARYVQEKKGSLDFPFKRYQIQKVWRGERPQEGRFREFYQADIDIIDRDSLPIFYDLEIPHLIHEIVSNLPIPPIKIHINNRKILEGFYRGLGIDDIISTLRIVDKLVKIAC